MKKKSINELNSEIQSLIAEIDHYIKKRDYNNAEFLQKKLDILVEELENYQSMKNNGLNQNNMKKNIEIEKNEVDFLKNEFKNQLKKLLNEFQKKINFTEFDNNHEIKKYENKFSEKTHRITPKVNNLIKIENYYVKNRDFQMAQIIKNQILDQTKKDLLNEKLISFKSQNNIEKTLNNTFKNKFIVLNDHFNVLKLKLKKDLEKKLLINKNKFTKQLTIENEKNLPINRLIDYNLIFIELEEIFNNFKLNNIILPKKIISARKPTLTYKF